MEASELEALKDKQMEVRYLKIYIDRIYIDLYIDVFIDQNHRIAWPQVKEELKELNAQQQEMKSELNELNTQQQKMIDILSEMTKRLERLAEKINWSVLKTFGEEVCLWMNDCLGLQTLVSPIGDLNSQES